MGGAIYVLAALDGTPFFASALEMIGKIINCLKSVLSAFQSSINVMGAADESVTGMISAAATTVATILVVIELCTQAMGFHFEDINDAVRFVFKVVVYKIIIENSSKIVSMVYNMFMNSAAWKSINEALKTVNTRFTGDDGVKGKIEEYYLEFARTDDSFLKINQLIVSLALVGAVIIVIIICVNIITSIAGLMFELCIDVAIAPVPIATLVNSQTRQIGINFIKGFAGNCLTLTMYTICFSVYGNLVPGISTGFSGLLSTTSIFSSIGIILPEIVGLLLLSVAIKNVGNMINKVLS